MGLRVCILPRARKESIDPTTGVGSVVYAQNKLLSAYGIEITEDYTKADIYAPHMQLFDLPYSYGAPVTILHSHGMFWNQEEGIFGSHASDNNKSLALSARRANYITVPSNWVREVYMRDMRVTPFVVGHGIYPEQWSSARNDGFIFYGKNRESDSCTSKWAYELARRGEFVISTFAPKNVPKLNEDKFQVMGYQPQSIIKDRLSHADIYLASTKETFGIGTLEAMASSVPILGFDWGGTSDIVRHKVDGYLTKVGDVDDLMRGIQFIRDNRKQLSINARQRAEQYAWDKVIGQYAELYGRVYTEHSQRKTGVSVIITAYNYAHYLPNALNSVLAQTYPVDEIIVVDDGSTDDVVGVMRPYLANEKRVKFIQQSNQGVAVARNNGIKAATQPFIVCLDPDDELRPTYIEACRDKMLSDRALGIVYTGLIYFDDEHMVDEKRIQLTPFNFALQTKNTVPPPTCIPCAAMFRRDLWERVGGYKQRYAPAEDTEFWMRMIMAGCTVDVASNKGLFLYRGHAGSASRTLKYHAIDDDKPYLTDRQYPFAAPAPSSPAIRSYSEPAIAVVIEVSAGQEYNVVDAIDSVLAQPIREWELGIDNKDAPLSPEVLQPYPFIKQIRDLRASLRINLPANNKLQPNALERFALSILSNQPLKEHEIYQSKGVDMSNCCGGNGDATIAAKRMLGLLPKEPMSVVSQDGRVKMMFIGDRRGPVEYRVGKDVYIGANNNENRFAAAKQEHVNDLLKTGNWAVYQEERVIERKTDVADYQVDQATNNPFLAETTPVGANQS